mgnify:CR=1 FL=1
MLVPMFCRTSVFPLLCAALLPLSGCSRAEAALPYAHEIEDTVLMGALGVDLKEGAPGRVAVTVSSGGRSGAGDSPGQSPVVLSAQAETVSAACAEMQTFGSDFVFFGDVEHVLVGERAGSNGRYVAAGTHGTGPGAAAGGPPLGDKRRQSRGYPL